MSGNFRQIEHTADIGIEVIADTLEELFETAARAIVSIISNELPEPADKRSASFSADDRESLLVDFLNEIIYMASAEGWITCSSSVSFKDDTVSAVFKGSESEGGIDNEVKAATYHNLGIQRPDRKWKARVYFDV